MNVLRLFGCGCLVLIFSGCPKDPIPPTPDADSGIDADVDAAGPATCATWCKHALVLGCAAAKPTAGGASCEDVCNNAQKSTVQLARFNLKCRIGAKTCTAADNCEN